MRLGLMTGYSGAQVSLDIELIKEAEKLGYDSVWTAEAWGSDAVSPLAWIGALTSKIRLGTAIMQLPGRSPANTAMTAMTLDSLSGGRFILGLGTSGPQVVEGWHGVSFDKPLTWLREYVTIVRAVLAREKPLEFQGVRYQIPYQGPGATGLGKPLKSILHGRQGPPHLHRLDGAPEPGPQRRDLRRPAPDLHAPRALRRHRASPPGRLRHARAAARASPPSTWRPRSRSSSATISTPVARPSR